MSGYMDDELSSRRAEEEALEWFVRRGGGLDEAEEAAFQAWLHADAAHVRAYAHWQQAWSELDALPADAIDGLRRKLARDIAAEGVEAGPHFHPVAPAARSSPRPLVGKGVGERASASLAADRERPLSATPCPHVRWWRGALWRRLAPRPMLAGACLTLLLAGAITWVHWSLPVFSASYVTARGETAELELPDGSRLQLDTASRAEVALMRGRREVRLPEGQARFEISGDAERPFSVLAGPLRITVVGTRFVVRFTPDAPEHGGIRVAVEEGQVRVTRNRWFGFGSEAIELAAGQAVASDAAGELGAVAEVAPGEIAPWRHNRISFNDATLQTALAEFERYGDTGLVVRDPAVAALRLTGTFDPRRPENFARLLPQALPVTLVAVGGVTEIRPRK